MGKKKTRVIKWKNYIFLGFQQSFKVVKGTQNVLKRNETGFVFLTIFPGVQKFPCQKKLEIIIERGGEKRHLFVTNKAFNVNEKIKITKWARGIVKASS